MRPCASAFLKRFFPSVKVVSLQWRALRPLSLPRCIRHLVDHRVVRLTFVRTDAQHADGFTKPLGKGPFRAWQRLLLRGSMQ